MIPPRLVDVLGVAPGPGAATCAYMVAGLDATSTALAEGARLLADDAMVLRCGESPLLGSWRQRASGGPPHALKVRLGIEAFVKDTFGLPGSPGTANLLQGFVGELLWHRLVSEGVAPNNGRKLVHVAELSWSAYQQGGDGLVVYEVTGGQLVFRLWEIKKHDSAAHLSYTIGRACTQLTDNAVRYLAQFTGYGSRHDGELGRLYGQLVPLWLDEDPRAGVGVAIATSAKHAPKRRGFGSLAAAFPQFAAAGQREGLVVAVDQFPQFATQVQEAVWSGL